jgi:Flp pilus assembly protein TadG
MAGGSAQRGSASVELVLATPVLVALMLLAVAGGRLASSRGEVDAAARDSARAASLARSAAAAQRNGQAAAAATLADRHVTCQSLAVTIDLTDFRPGGAVASTVGCTVGLGDLTGLGLPGVRTVTATFAAPVDRYRAVAP